jgi:hypothetical protein
MRWTEDDLKEFCNRTGYQPKEDLKSNPPNMGSAVQPPNYDSSTQVPFRPELQVPTESVEQICLFRWAANECEDYPELELMYHVPNGGSRNKIEAARLKAEGVKPGVPDIVLPVPRGGYHGLYIELKRIRGGKTSEEQKGWIEKLTKQGYYACICKGHKEAEVVIINYLRLE